MLVDPALLAESGMSQPSAPTGAMGPPAVGGKYLADSKALSAPGNDCCEFVLTASVSQEQQTFPYQLQSRRHHHHRNHNRQAPKLGLEPTSRCQQQPN